VPVAYEGEEFPYNSVVKPARLRGDGLVDEGGGGARVERGELAIRGEFNEAFRRHNGSDLLEQECDCLEGRSY
jgi:hypothetical protein